MIRNKKVTIYNTLFFTHHTINKTILEMETYYVRCMPTWHSGHDAAP